MRNFKLSAGAAKTALRAAAFVLVLILAMLLAGRILQPEFNDSWYSYDAAGIFAEEDDSIDVLVMGSSNAARSVIPIRWYHDYGISGYCFAQQASTLTQDYYCLKTLFKTQSPKVVVISADTLFNYENDISPVENTLLDAARYYFPLVRYHNKWTGMTLSRFNIRETINWRDEDKGYYPMEGITPVDENGIQWFMYPTGNTEQVSLIRRIYLKKLQQLCADHGATLLMVAVPGIDWSMATHLGAQEWADEAGVPFLDMNLPENIPIDWTTDTADKGFHLNINGAIKVSDMLGEWITSQCDLPDHRGEEAYAQWDEDYEKYLVHEEKLYADWEAMLKDLNG